MESEHSTWQRYLSEFAGTALLVLLGVGSVPALAIARGETASGTVDLGFVGLAFAAALVVSIHAFGYISGCHINPAVTVALASVGRFPWRDVPGYLIAQCAGAIGASAVLLGVLGAAGTRNGLGVASIAAGVPAAQAFAAEFVGTFVLVFVILAVTHPRATPGWAALSIGLTLFAAIVVLGPVTGASLNPARSLGPLLIQQLAGGSVDAAQLPLYVAAQTTGAVVAAVAFVLLHRAPRAAAASSPARTERSPA